MEHTLKLIQKSDVSHKMSFHRICILALCLMILPIVALAAPKDKVTLRLNNVALATALGKIEEQTDYKLSFPYDEVQPYKVTCDIRNKSVSEAMKEVLKATPLTYDIDGEFITVYARNRDKATVVTSSKTGGKCTISGIVVDDKDEPLAGVAVIGKNKNIGVVTDINGHFFIEAPIGEHLLFSYVGMEPFEMIVKKNENLNIILKDVTALLDNVVVTGYQTISKERAAGAYDVIDGNIIKDKISLNNDIFQCMEGLVTGLNVNMSEGADKFIVRGITSINSSRAPLFVVDGIPLENNQVQSLLNSNDIENVTILKDATAASIWGSQAANGVIVITTKKGKENSTIKISYNGGYSYTGKPDYNYQNLMDNEMFIRNAKEMFDQYVTTYSYAQAQKGITGLSNSTYPILLPHERLMYQYHSGEIDKIQYEANIQKLLSQNGRDDYEKYFLSDQQMTRHTISLTGGNDKTTHYLSLGYLKNWCINKDIDSRYTFNLNEEFKLTRWLKWNVVANASFYHKNGHLSPWSDYKKDNLLSCRTKYINVPYANFVDASGGQIDWSVYTISAEKRKETETLSGMDMSFYPIKDFDSTISKTINTNIRINSNIRIDLIKGLKFENIFQYSRFHSKEENYYPEDMWKIREEILASTPASTPTKPWLPTTGGNFLLNNGITSDWTFRNQFIYNVNIKDNLFQISSLIGTELREYLNTNFINFLRGYDIQTMKYTPYDDYNLNRVSGALIGSSVNVFNKTYFTQSEYKRRFFSLYGNLTCTFNNKYTINASLRFDQSNLFGSNPGNQYKPIWAIGGLWRMSDEKFMRDNTLIDRLILRITYGFAGNSPLPGQGGAYDILHATSSSFFETPGFEISTPANGQITWEKTRTWNVGFDINIFNNRLNINFNYYDKKTSDLIGEMLLNPTTGWLSTTGNVGTMTNKGFELSLTSQNLHTNNFNWETILTLSNNNNKITKLTVATPYIASTLASYSGAMNVEGYPVNTLFSYRYAGLNDKGEPQVYNQKGEIVSGIGSRSLGAEDVISSGSTIPKFYGALTNILNYRDFSLSFMFIYNFGNKMRREVETFNYGRPIQNLLKSFDNRWRYPGDETRTNIPGWFATKNSTANYELWYFSDVNVLDASYIKLRDITLSYNIPSSICKKFYTNNIRINFQIGNVFYWAANHDGIDPEYYQLDAYTNARKDKFGPTYAIDVNINF